MPKSKSPLTGGQAVHNDRIQNITHSDMSLYRQWPGGELRTELFKQQHIVIE